MAHISVLLKEAVNGLAIKKGDTVLDATFGGGGHSREICKIVGEKGALIAIDADEEARNRISAEMKACRFELVTANFRQLDKVLGERDITELDAALFDLGLSSFQLDISEKGFTFQKDQPLKMTFGSGVGTDSLTTDEIVNHWDEENIADIIYGYGGEQFSRRIAHGIIEARQIKPIKSTLELVKIIEESVPEFYKKRKIHPATKTFQALRITVNDEMGALKEALAKVWKVIRPGGRLAVISFHELEDRIVKNFLRDKKKENEAEIITKKPMVPDDEEIKNNPRSRSAKLRIGEKN